jgi:hypothetical protein
VFKLAPTLPLTVLLLVMRSTKRPRIKRPQETDESDESITSSPVHFEGTIDPLVIMEEDKMDGEATIDSSDSEHSEVAVAARSPTAVASLSISFNFGPEAAVADDRPVDSAGRVTTTLGKSKKPRKLDPSRHDSGVPSVL